MPISPASGGRGGGTGRGALGPQTNTFGTAATANRAAAVALRNAYANANAAWLALYDANRGFFIQLEWSDGDALQRRNRAGDDWEDVTSIIVGPRGPGPTDEQVTAGVQTGVKAYARTGGPQVPDTEIPAGIMRDAELTAEVVRGLLSLTAEEANDLLVGATLVGQTLTLPQADGSSIVLTLPAGSGGADGVVASGAFSGNGETLTLTLSTGATVDVNVPAILRAQPLTVLQLEAFNTEREVAGMRMAWHGRHAELAVTTRIQGLAATAQANRDVALVLGAPGTGKTHALKRFCAERSSAWYVSMRPSVRTPARVVARIAKALGIGVGTTAAADLGDQIVAHLAGRNALVVVDESHHLTPMVIDEIRCCIVDEAECGLVLAGNEPLYARITGGERGAQIKSRVGARCYLGLPTETDALALAEMLLQRRPEGKGRKTVLEAAAGEGGLRAVSKLVAIGSMLARNRGRDTALDEDLLGAAAHMGMGR